MIEHDLGPTMTVQELIDALQSISNKQLPVITQGCDCFGTAFAVHEDGDEVTIMRDRQ